MIHKLATFAVLPFALLVSTIAVAQQSVSGGLDVLVRTNEQLGVRLLNLLHEASPERNIAITPVPVTLTLAMFHDNDREETKSVLEWDPDLDFDYSSRMFLGAFDKVRPPEPKKVAKPKTLADIAAGFGENSLWLTQAIVYRTPSDVPRVFVPYFVRDAEKFYGFQFVDLRDRRPDTKDLEEAMRGLSLTKLPAFNTQKDPGNDFAITSAMHLGCRWMGNLFVESPETEGDFVLKSGVTKHARMLTGEMEVFDHAKNADFEAVSLPCYLGSMTVIVPAPQKSVEEIARKIAADPAIVSSAMHPEMGNAVVPKFEFSFQSEFKPILESFGLKSVFTQLDRFILVKDSHLTEVNQSVHIRLDKSGVYADAGTVGGGILGGIMGGVQPFHMVVNRPFLFLIHDKSANILLFAGVVMDPTQN